jgi:glycogen synthase
MNILHIVPSLDPKAGGVAEGVKTLSSAIAQQSVSCEIVTLDPFDAAYHRDPNITCHNLAATKNRWGYSPKLFPWPFVRLLDAITIA